ncbi:MAG TPA: site-specific DNA-methyltransferase [Gammaproteobacteria bacterium]|nr:site-specific DNA-methyltransferase [Gammaproteobacteria bacterium]
MKPRANIQIYNEDCLPAMRQMKDNEFDLAIVDPPYGKKPIRNDSKTFGSPNTSTFSIKDQKWDIRPSKEYFKELFRVSKNQIIWGANYFIDFLKPTNSMVVWDKLTGKNMYADCEIAWTNFSCVIKKFTLQWRGSHCHREEMIIHPTQKPIKLYKWLLNHYAKPGDRILDTHLGSGSIAIACWDMGFDLVGYEIDKDYYEAAMKRFQKHKEQFQLDLAV